MIANADEADLTHKRLGELRVRYAAIEADATKSERAKAMELAGVRSMMLIEFGLEPLLTMLQQKFGDDLFGVVLYGSHARGTARPDSDVDLLVIARSLPPGRAARSEFFVDLQFEAGYLYPPASVLSKTLEEFEHQFPSLYLDIGLDGIVLFDQAGYTAGKLARIRSLIQEAGLVRRQLNGEFIWQFTHPVTPANWSLDWDGYRECA